MTLALGDLTTVANYNSYATSPLGAPILGRTIRAMSRTILTALNRPLLIPKTYTQQFNGTGTRELVLPNYPVLSDPVPTLTVRGVALSVAPQANSDPPAFPYGFRFQPWDSLPPGNPAVLELVGGAWYGYGSQNVVVTYRAGYQITGEIPDGTSYSPLAPYGIWATDEGVTYASDGTNLTAISSGTPGIGQYVAPTPDGASGAASYSFNSADIVSGLLINYGYVPSDIEQCCIDLISERTTYRTRIGLRSQSLAGQESIAYDTSGITAYIKNALCDYVSVIPPNLGANT